MSFDVSLHLPDLCDPGDWSGTEPTPLNAVEDFQNTLGYSDHLYAYRVHDNKTGKDWIVDTSDDSVKEDNRPSTGTSLALGEWCRARLKDSRESDEIDRDVSDAVIEREAEKLERLVHQIASSFVDNEFNEKE